MTDIAEANAQNRLPRTIGEPGNGKGLSPGGLCVYSMEGPTGLWHRPIAVDCVIAIGGEEMYEAIIREKSSLLNDKILEWTSFM